MAIKLKYIFFGKILTLDLALIDGAMMETISNTCVVLL